MKKGKIIAALAMTVCMVTGCVDHMPDMTDEQSSLVAEYAANMLLKHSTNYQYRLADEEELLEETEETQTTSEQETEEAASSESEETEITQAQTEETGTEEAAEPDVLSMEDADFAQALGLEQVSIYLDGYEVNPSYPMQEGVGFSVNASQGNQLVILHFTVENISSDSVNCSFYETNPVVAFDINGAGYRNALTTLLTNDFSTYEETIPSGESREVVAVLEMASEQAEQIETLSVRVSGAAGAVTAQVD